MTLFPDLPDQTPPTTLYTDQHALETCHACVGIGQVERPEPPTDDQGYPAGDALSWLLEAMDRSPVACPTCHGAGRVLRFVGRVRDVAHD